MPKPPKERQEHRRRLALAKMVSTRLKVKRQNAVLFAAVAKEMGRKWVPGTRKVLGYDMVVEYARIYGIGSPPEPESQRVPQPRIPPEAKVAFLMSFEWRRLRMQVIKKRGARCECCGASPKDGTTVINVDHVKPRKLFPELALEESNLQVLCGSCNHGKGNWDQTDWRSA